MADGLRRALAERASRLSPPGDGFDRLVRLRRRRRRNQRVIVAVGALALSALALWGVVVAVGGRSPQPGPRPRPAFEPLTPKSAPALRPTWTGSLVPEVMAAPTATDFEVYAAPLGRLFAFEPGCRSRGTPCPPTWRGTIPVPSLWSANPKAPAVADGLVVVASDVLTAFPERCTTRGRECRPRWTTAQGPDTQPLSEPVVADGRVFVGAPDGRVLSYSMTCGADGEVCRPLWTARTGGSLSLAPPAAANGIVAAASDRLYVYPQSCEARCRPLWTAPIDGLSAGPAAGSGWVYAVAEDTLLAFPAACRTDGGVCSPTWRFTEPRGRFLSAPAVGPGSVFVASHRLYALAADCATRGGRCTPEWRSAAGPVAYSQPAVGAGLVAVTSDRVEVYALECGDDQASCPPLFAGSRITPGVPLSRPAIAGSGVFVASNDGRLVALQVPRRRSSPRP